MRWTLAAMAVLVCVAVAGGYLFLKTAMFHNYVLRKIEQAATQSTGAETRVGSVDLNLATLTVRLQNIVLRGQERPQDPPLLRVEELSIGVKIVSVFHRKVSLSELLIKHPVAHIQVDAEGASNVPQAANSQPGSQTSVFDLAIKHFALTSGEVYYNDQKIPVDATLYDLDSDLVFNSVTRTCAGSLSYRNGELVYGSYAPMMHSSQLQFTASPSRLSLKSAVVKVGSSVLSFSADVNNFSNPGIVGSYEINVHTQDFAAMSPGAKPAGDFRVAGTMHYQKKGNQSVLRSIEADGDVHSAGISALSAEGKLEVRKLKGRYDLANGNLRADGIELESLGGTVTGAAEMQNLDATPVWHVRAAFRGISLRAMQQSVRRARLQPVSIAGTLEGTAEAAWTGSVRTMHARSDLNMRGGATSAHDNASIPVDAAIHAVYDGQSDTLMVRQSNIRAASLVVTADGEVSRHSRLQIHAKADDLHQLAVLASSFGTGGWAPPSISGSATLDANVQGSLRQARISGQLNAPNLHVQGSDWRAVALSFAATPSEISISNGSLVSANQGRASFDAKIGLRNWAYNEENSIHANLSVQRMAISDLQHLANVQYPVSGDLTAHVSFGGSQLNPSGSGSADISNARAYGEPIQTLSLKFQASNGAISSSVNVAAPAGSATATLGYNPKQREYKVKLDAPSIVLQKLHALASKQELKGTLSAAVSGAGTLDNPQLDALIRIPKLEAQQKTIAGLKADVRVANHRASLVLDSQISEATVRAHAQIDLTGDYQTDAAIDTSVIPLDALLQTLASSVPEGLQGETELHATLKGPLKDKTRLEAHLAIPKLDVSYQQFQIGAARPVQADYSNSVITVQPAEIRGTGTSLRVEGKIPLAGSTAPDLTARGTIDARILKLVQPGLQSSGTATLDLRAIGTAKDPSVRGQIRVQDVAVSTTEAPLGVEKLNGTLDVGNDRVQISSMTAQVGSGQASLGGAVIYRPNLQFTLALQGNSIRLRYPSGLRTVLDGNLALTGNTQASSLTGRVLVDSLSFTPEFDLSTFGDQFSSNVAAPSQPGFADTIRLTVAVQSKDNLSATSSQVSIEGSANLKVTGTAANPVITGRTELAAGELFYRGNRYQLERGVITFADPNQTNPNLNVSAATTVEQYNLTINLRGTLDRLTTTYASDPPLATADIIHLIAFGKTTSESAAANASQSTDSMVASGALGAGLSGGAQKLAGVSSLQIDPLLGGNNQNPSARIALQQRVTKNFLFTFSTDVSQPGEEVVQGDYQINKRWSVNVTRDQLGGVTVAGRFHTKF